MAQLRPTFSESWYRVTTLKARLRGSTQISRQHHRGERWYVVRDPAGNQYHRLSSAAYRFVGLLDGSRTVGEAWDLVGGQLADDAPTQPEVIQILSQLHAANLLEANITADATVLLRRHKQLRKRQLQGRLMNVLFPRIPLWDPDRFLCKWMPVMRVVLSKLGWLVWFATIFAAAFVLAPKWNELRGAASNATDPANWPFLWATFVLIKLIHELGHAFSCRRFGGEVHELGIMFLVFIPAPYVDASSAWSLPSRWQRSFVGAGGMIFELFVAAIMGFIWANTGPGLVNQLAYNAMLIASVSTLVFNANPLLRYDGYYILSDLLEIPNLQQKSKDYALGLIKRHVFGVKSPLPLPPPVQRIWLFVYAIASGIYRIFVGIAIIFVVTNKVPVLGVLMALGGVVTWLVVPVYKIANYLMLDPELHRKRTRAGTFVLATAAAAAFVIGFIPFKVHYEATGVVVPRAKTVLFAQSPGFVTEVVKSDGDRVSKGDPILVCFNVQEFWHLKSLQLRTAALEAKMTYERATDPPHYLIDKNLHDGYYAQEIADSKRKLEELIVRAPMDGVLIAPDIKQIRGKFFHQGEELGASVAQMEQYVVDGFLDDRDVALPFSSGDRNKDSKPQEAKIRLAGAVSTELTGPVIGWGASAITELKKSQAGLVQTGGGDLVMNAKDPNGKTLEKPQFPVLVGLDNSKQTYYAGQKAYLRFELGKKSLAWQWYRRLGQLIQTHSSENKWL